MTEVKNTEKQEENPADETSTAGSIHLEGEKLREALKKQIEYYFSKENLMIDRYLASQMNSEMFIPIKTIAEFKLIKDKTSDLELLINVLKECPSVVVNEDLTMVKPALKPQRNTLILRDIPSSTSVEEITKLFNPSHCGKIVDVKSDVGDSWYIVFESEEAATKGFEYIRTVTFLDKPIRARIKTESAFFNFYSVSHSRNDPSNQSHDEVNVAPYRGSGGFYVGGWIPGGRGQGVVGGQGNHMNYYWEGGIAVPLAADLSVPRFESRRGQGSQGNFTRNRRNGRGNRGRGREGRENREGREYQKDRRRGKSPPVDSGTSSILPTDLPQLGSADFPPLPSQKVSPGYSHEFKKFSKEEILAIYESVRAEPSLDNKEPGNKLEGTFFSPPQRPSSRLYCCAGFAFFFD